jgi:hypothetical protein
MSTSTMLRAYCEADVKATMAVFKALPQKRRWRPPVTASGHTVRRPRKP